MNYEVIVVGAGHAGCEGALACARLGMNTLLLTLNMDAIALMACNPVIGGTAKGHLVREIDALGGEMGKAIDETFLQSRMLNLGKGPAVHSLRAQADKKAYQNRMRKALFSQENLTVREGEVGELLVKNGRVEGIKTTTDSLIYGQSIILACGVFLKSRIIIGERTWQGGPQGLMAATELSQSLTDLGFNLRRFKTGTPARVDERTIDFDKMALQPGDEPVVPFSFLTDQRLQNTMACYLTWTNPKTHQIILANLHRAPMYKGDIKGTGARYCPSIEDKIVRFADKDRHQIFLEPEGAQSNEWYVQGMSSSMPEEVQWLMYRSIAGLERCQLTRLAYAIEYDCIDSKVLKPTLESLTISGLYFAGQINGTSGYEEAAAQGLMAGVNATRKIRGEEPFVLTRDMAYIGVLIDDLTTKGADEPYRMMTSRAEYRLTLRQDNADIRLTPLGYQIGLAEDRRMEQVEKKMAETKKAIDYIEKTMVPISPGRDELLKVLGETPPASPLPASNLLKRPKMTFEQLTSLLPDLQRVPADAAEQAEIEIKYEGYLKKQDAQIQKTKALENKLLPEGVDYNTIDALRIEARQKLQAQRPHSLGQAGRIPGVSPADVAVLMVWLEKHKGQ